MLNKTISHIKQAYTGSLCKMREIPCAQLNTETCKMLGLFICDNHESYTYGYMHGIFEYKDGRIFDFTWRIHTPKQKYAHLSNRMTNIQQIITKYYKIADYNAVEHINTDFGSKGAFWLYTPLNSLTGEDYDLRILMQTIKKWAVEEQLCKKIRKTDKKHIEWRKTH